MNETEVLDRLRASVDRAGGMSAWGRKHGVSTSYVSMVLLGHKPLTDAVLAPLGIERVVTYRDIRRPDTGGIRFDRVVR